MEKRFDGVMWIRIVELLGFGRLSGRFRFEPECCNVVCQLNEFGKTTLVDAILYTLYGMPSTGFKRTELKPSERYQPWKRSGDIQRFATVLEIELDEERRYRIQTDFSNPKRWFEVRDARTGQPVRGVAESFGTHFFKMSSKGFRNCFLLRQEGDNDESGREALVQAIEHIVTSSSSQRGASVRKAIELLGDVRMAHPQLAEGPIKLDTLLRRMSDRIAEVRRELQRLENEQEERNRIQDSLASKRQELHELEREELKLQAALLLREIKDLESRLQTAARLELEYQNQLNTLRHLETYKNYSPEEVPHLQQLLARVEQLEENLKSARVQLATRFDEPLATLQRELATFPSALSQVDSKVAKRLERDATLLATQQEDLRAIRNELQAVQERLESAGVPVEHVSALVQRREGLSQEDFRILVTYRRKRLELDTQIAEAARQQAEIATRVTEVRGRIATLRNLVLAQIVAAVVFGGLGIAAFLGKSSGVALGLTFVAALATIGALLVRLRVQRLGATELDLALHEESAKHSDVRRLEEKREELESVVTRLLTTSGLNEDDLLELERFSDHQADLRDFLRLRSRIDELETLVGETKDRAIEIVRLFHPTISKNELESVTVESCARNLERYFEIDEKVKSLREQRRELAEQIAADDAQLANSLTELRAILDKAEAEGLDLRERVRNYVRGSEKAREWRLLAEQVKSMQILSEDEKRQKQQDLEAKRKRLDEILQRDPVVASEYVGAATRSLADLEQALGRLHERIAQQREEYGRQVQFVDMKLQDWRTRFPQLCEELRQLEREKTQLDEMQEALNIAADRLSNISQKLAANWSVALRERIEGLLSGIAPHYRDVSVSESLEISLYSEEAGRRLSGRELGHLSKGTRDQIELALRVATSEYLTEHLGRVPLLLDEPFAHWDDERFVRGVEWLTRLAKLHQVILLTCQRQRFEWLKLQCPELYEQLHFSEFESATF